MIKLTAFLILFTACASEAGSPNYDAGNDAQGDGGSADVAVTSLWNCQTNVCGAAHTATCGCVPAGYVAPPDTACTSTTLTACQKGCGQVNGCL